MIPRFRVIPPSPAQLAADAEAPHIHLFGSGHESVLVATAAVGLGAIREGGVIRLLASRGQALRLLGDLGARDASAAEPLARYLRPQAGWRLRTRVLPLDRPYIVGILNLTDDSFSGDGVGHDVSPALERAHELVEAGADIIDVGAETARADRPVLEAEREVAIVAPVITALAKAGFVVSSDTYKPLVARAALESGAEIVNDISGLTLGAGAAAEAARAGAGYVLNYSYSVPKRRPDAPPVYADVVSETIAWMEQRVAELEATGLGRARIAIDPGIAFGKSHDEDIQVLRRAGEFLSLGLPVYLAHSRKNFIGSISGRAPGDRDPETHVASALALEQGVRLFRVHDVAGTRRALGVAGAIATANAGDFAPDAASWPWRAGASATHMTRLDPDKPPPSGQRW